MNPAAGIPQKLTEKSNLLIDLPNNEAHIMPHFHHNLVGVGKMCDGGCTIVFNKKTVRLLSERGRRY